MHFHTLEFALFFSLVAALFFLVPVHRRKFVLLFGNAAFVALMAPREAALVAALAAAVYAISLGLLQPGGAVRRAALFWTGLAVVGGFLAVMKFMRSGATSLSLHLSFSFVAFPLIAYLADLRSGKLRSAPRALDFAVFSSFFPTVLSGPVIRPQEFLKQIETGPVVGGRNVRDFVDRFTVGLVKKMLLADPIGVLAAAYLAGAKTGSVVDYTIFLYAILFQVYFDFSGYTDMARGVASLIGVELPENFRSPLSAENPVDFWRRWHISLSEFFRDYVYYPVFFRWKSIYFATICAFLLNGAWHGFSGNFVLLGVYWALSVSGYLYIQSAWDAMPRWLRVAGMFHIFLASFIFFHPEGMKSGPWAPEPFLVGVTRWQGAELLALVPGCLCLSAFGWVRARRPDFPYYSALLLLWFAVFFFGAGHGSRYIYSQF